MAKLSYVTHLDIPVKYKGTILHAYEYNATVNKINEIVDHLHTSYEYTAAFPRFDIFDDIFASTAPGSAVIIHNDFGKLYPVTSSAYVIVDTNKTLDDEIQDINSYISSGLNDAYEKIAYTQNLVNEYYIYSHNLTYDLSENINHKFDDLNSYISTLCDDMTTKHNADIDALNTHINNKFGYVTEEFGYVNNEITYIQNLINKYHQNSYSYSYDSINELSNYLNGRIDDLQNYVDNSYAYVTHLYDDLSYIHNSDITYFNDYINGYILSQIAYNKNYIEQSRQDSYTYAYQLYDDLSYIHNSDVTYINEYIASQRAYTSQLYDDLTYTHNSDVTYINEYIASQIAYTQDIIRRYNSYSYSHSYDSISDLSNYLNGRIDDLRNYIDNNFVNATDYNDDITYLTDLFNGLSYNHQLDIDNLNSYNSYVESNINDIYNKISYTNQLIDDYYTYSYSYSYALTSDLHNTFETKLSNLRSYVNEINDYLSGAINQLAEIHAIDVSNILSYIPSYVAGFGISIDEDNVVSVNTNEIVDNRSIYVNSYGQLVVNNEVVLHDAEKSFVFIDEHGNWVGDMANVKNYIDNSISTLENELNERIAYNTNEIT